jgi:leader peptidase (prepilin peptidase)/N-methyltransferase
MNSLFWWIFAIFWGGIWGSFFNVCIFRIPQKLSILKPSSFCPKCKTKIQWYDNIPIFSFILLKGKCRNCRAKISLQYPLIEFLSIILSVSLCYMFLISSSPSGFFAKLSLFFTYFAFCSVLIVISGIDIKTMLIPNIITLPGIMICLILSKLVLKMNLSDSIFGALFGYGVIWAIAVIYERITKRKGMGLGDAKLLAMIAAFLGWQCLGFILLAASIQGLILGSVIWATQKKDTVSLAKTKIPFGPFLSIAAIEYIFLKDSFFLNIFYI